ncbi:MAG: outer membrane beta-barrel protein, partial [Pseudomonadota bacterium]
MIRCFAATLCASMFTFGTATADEPKTRYCEAGYGFNQTDEEEQVLGLGVSTDLDTGNGGGFRAACQFEAILGIYGFGEYRTGSFDADVVNTDPIANTIDIADGDFDIDQFRLAIGLDQGIFDVASIYGQVGIIWTDYDADVAFLDGLLDI